MKKLLIISAITIGLGILVVPEVTHAQSLVGDVIPKDPSQLGKQDIIDVLVWLIRWALLFASAIASIFIVVNGYQYILAAGNPEKIEKAKQGLTWSIMGFILVISSYGIVALLQQVLQSKNRVNQVDVPGTPNSVGSVLENLAMIIFVFGGATAVLFLILGGYRYITSQGNPDLAESAKKTVLYAVIGLIVVFMSALLFNLVASTLGSPDRIN